MRYPDNFFVGLPALNSLDNGRKAAVRTAGNARGRGLGRCHCPLLGAATVLVFQADHGTLPKRDLVRTGQGIFGLVHFKDSKLVVSKQMELGFAGVLKPTPSAAEGAAEWGQGW